MNSFITWIGGKKLLRKRILEEFPEEGSFGRYIEVFGGAGWILFSKDRHASMEVFNDANGNLINLYRIVKYHPEELQRELNWILVSRDQFFHYVKQDQTGLTDIQRAARFFVLIKESFGASCDSFGIRPKDMDRAVKYLTAVSQRLRPVVIENVDFEQLLSTYDRKYALFYLDPPYFNAEKYYADKFSREDHNRLKRALEKLQGKFILSYNDCPEIRELYAGYHIMETQRQDSLATKKEVRSYSELIIKNF